MKAELIAAINPSEDIEKIKKAFINIAPDAYEFEISSDQVRCQVGDLTMENILETIKIKKLNSVLLRLLERHDKSGECILMFNRQAAFVGSINLCETSNESPLGPIFLKLKERYVREIFDSIDIERVKKGYKKPLHHYKIEENKRKSFNQY